MRLYYSVNQDEPRGYVDCCVFHRDCYITKEQLNRAKRKCQSNDIIFDTPFRVFVFCSVDVSMMVQDLHREPCCKILV